jgi:hypothetical protein
MLSANPVATVVYSNMQIPLALLKDEHQNYGGSFQNILQHHFVTQGSVTFSVCFQLHGLNPGVQANLPTSYTCSYTEPVQLFYLH